MSKQKKSSSIRQNGIVKFIPLHKEISIDGKMLE